MSVSGKRIHKPIEQVSLVVTAPTTELLFWLTFVRTETKGLKRVRKIHIKREEC